MNKISLLQTIYNNEADLLNKVRVFVDKGTDLSAVTEYCESALRVASNNGRFDVVNYLLDSGADVSQLGWSSSFFALAFGSISELKKSLSENNDMESRDFWERTLWLLAIQLGNIEKASLLLKLGADRNARGRCLKIPFAYAIQHNNIAMLEWLVENKFDIEMTDEFMSTPLIIASELGMTDCVTALINHGADIYKKNHIPERAIEVASNLEIVRILIAQGDDINDISEETFALLTGTQIDGTPKVSSKEYFAGKHRCFGSKNPEHSNNTFYLDMIKTGVSAWGARDTYSNTDGFNDPAVWSYRRFGRSTTILNDGRIVVIAGEHEDHYDEDFCIYNDIVVFAQDGAIDMFSYPKESFPPTDFHTATLVDNQIFIIGCLGYPESRQTGYTPVFALDINTMKIKKIETTGIVPGWISFHKAVLKDNSNIIIKGGEQWIDAQGTKDLIKNEHTYQLCLKSYQWSLLD